jgi:hypothetical protein
VKSIAQPPAQYQFAEQEPHAHDSPIDAQMPLWRYVDLGKLVSLFASSALFFTRADLLGDPFEGSITAHQLALRQAFEKREGLATTLNIHSQVLVETSIANTVISCWHMNENESAAMWRLYLSSNEGVAIRTSYSRLTSSFRRSSTVQELGAAGWKELLHITAEPVRYIDFDSEQTDVTDNPFVFKRTSFAHERELRLIVRDDSMQGDPRPSRFPGGGDYIPVDLRTLVETIYVAPSAPKWFAGVVQSLVAAYGFSFQVVQSALARSPLH